MKYVRYTIMSILDTVETLCQCVRYAFKSSSIIRAGDSKFSNSKRVMLIGFVFIEMQGGPRKVLHREMREAFSSYFVRSRYTILNLYVQLFYSISTSHYFRKEKDIFPYASWTSRVFSFII